LVIKPGGEDCEEELRRPKNIFHSLQFVKEYGNTAFYKEAFNSCGYLRDFVKKK